jgi:hypothetical protein
LQRLHVLGRDLIESNRIHQHELLDAIGMSCRESQGDGTAEIESDDRRARDA